jgi:predicted oxidoreductase
MNLIDTADVYGLDFAGNGFGSAEETLGRVFAAKPGLRDQVVLATKGGISPPLPYNSSTGYLLTACEESLRRLGVEVIDLYQIHRPDMFAHPEEVAAALSKLRESGKVREFGVSNYTVAQVEALVAMLDFPLAAHQPEFSAIHLEPMRDGTLDQCMRLGLTPLAYSPLGRGQLATGDRVRPELLALLDCIAQREQVDRTSVALAFVLAHPSRPVAIIGTQLSRLSDAVQALKVRLDRRDVYEIVQASEGVPLP